MDRSANDILWFDGAVNYPQSCASNNKQNYQILVDMKYVNTFIVYFKVFLKLNLFCLLNKIFQYAL